MKQLLMIAVGVLNSGKNFLVCFSYYPSKIAGVLLLLCGTRSKKNASNLTEICLLLLILVSSLIVVIEKPRLMESLENGKKVNTGLT
jgi:hypothetical protein